MDEPELEVAMKMRPLPSWTWPTFVSSFDGRCACIHHGHRVGKKDGRLRILMQTKRTKRAGGRDREQNENVRNHRWLADKTDVRVSQHSPHHCRPDSRSRRMASS